MNKVILSGNLARDPEVRYSQSGTAYARTAIAVSRPFSKNSDTTTDFFNLTIFGKQAEFCGRYLKKGSSVILEGRVENDNYEGKDGVKHYSVNIMVDHIEFAGSKRSNDGGESNSDGGYYNKPDTGTNSDSNYSNSNYDNDGDDVDVPF